MRTDEGLLMDTAQEAEGQIFETRDILEGLRAIPARKVGSHYHRFPSGCVKDRLICDPLDYPILWERPC